MFPAVTFILVSTGRSWGGGNYLASPMIAVPRPDDETVPMQWHGIRVSSDWIAVLFNEGAWYAFIEPDNDR